MPKGIMILTVKASYIILIACYICNERDKVDAIAKIEHYKVYRYYLDLMLVYGVLYKVNCIQH